MKHIKWTVWTFLSEIVLSEHVNNVFDDIIQQLLRPGGLFDDPFGGLSSPDAAFTFSDNINPDNLFIDVDQKKSSNSALSRPLAGLMASMKPFSLFDQFALMPDLLLSSLESMPAVVLSDKDCLVTIETRDLDADSMSVKVFTTGDSIQLEITKITQQNFFNDVPDEDAGDKMSLPENDGNEEKRSQSRLRGGATAMSSMTSVRRFAAPKDCEMTASSSKATIDKEGGKLLLKFPKKGEEEKNSLQITENITIEGAGTTGHERSQENSSNDQEKRGASSWWQSLMNFGSSREDNINRKIPIPLVKYDEF